MICLRFLICCSTVLVYASSNTLVQLHVLFRHGNRAADQFSILPNDPLKNEKYAPYGFGQLTLKGKKTEFAIGQYLRETYNKFIPLQYTPDVIDAITTNMKRTKMSLELVLAGLFPPENSQKIEKYLNWQPIPFNIEENKGVISIPLFNCPIYTASYFSYILSNKGQAIIKPYRNLYNLLSNYTGTEVNYPGQVSGIYVTLKSEEDFGYKLPEWASSLYPDIIEEAASVDYEFATANSRLKKLSAGFLLKKILENSYAKQNGTLIKDTRVFLYSAHEFNIAVMLRALNVFYRHVPPFGATIFFEIHNINDIFGLKLFYQDYTEELPKLLTIPGCDSFCSLEKLVFLVKDSIPSEFDVCSITDELV